MLTLAVLLLATCSAADAPLAPVRPDAREMERLLGLERTMARSRGALDGPEAASAGADVAQRVLQAGFEVDSAIADLQQEQTEVADVTSAIQADRDARVGVLNLAAGIFAVGAAVGTGMTLRDQTTTAGIWVTTITSGVGAVLTIYAAVAPNRGMPPARARSNLLAPFFGRLLVSGRYPRVVWAYLEAPAPGEALPRKERLVAEWQKLGRISPEASPRAQRRIDALCAPIQDRSQVDVDLLRDRSLMLGDVRAQVASMKLGLRSLLEAVRPGADLP